MSIFYWMIVLDDCHFLIQLSVYPATIQFSKRRSEMLGAYVKELQEIVSFHKKGEYLEKVISFNKIRNKGVLHKQKAIVRQAFYGKK